MGSERHSRVRRVKYHFGEASLAKLHTCSPLLVNVARRAISITPVDFTIVWGYRGEAEQNALEASGASHKRYPESKHNRRTNGNPDSWALDFAPWVDGRIYWGDTHMFALVAGVILSCAAGRPQPVELRWGGDWDGDGKTTDQTLMDWGHVELV